PFAAVYLARSLTAKTGSSPLGSANQNQINCLYRIGQLALFPSPIFLQINRGHAGPACCAFSCLRFPMRSKPLHSEGRGREFESRRARQSINNLRKDGCWKRERSYHIATKPSISRRHATTRVSDCAFG